MNGIDTDKGKSPAITQPHEGIEDKLVKIWAAVLNTKVDDIGIDDNFFELGGNSLKASGMIAEIQKILDVKVPMQVIFDMPMIEKLARYIRNANAVKYSPLKASEKKEYYPQSSAQKRLYFMSHVEPDSILYNMPVMHLYKKDIERERLEQAFRQLLKRHDSLRTSFALIDGESIQKIHDYQEISASFGIEYYEATEDGIICGWYVGKSHETSRPGCSTFDDVMESFVRPFNLEEPPLLRLSFINILNKMQVLLLDMHHMISDEISILMLLNELWALDEGKTLPSVNIQYKDFSQWSSSQLHQEELNHQEAYWKGELAGELPILNLPIDYPRPAALTFVGDTWQFELNPQETRQLKQIACQHCTTLYIILLSLYNVLLARLSGQEDIIIGTFTVGRQHAQLQQTVGMFDNTVALRNYPGPKKTFKSFLDQVRIKTFEAFENQDYPFEQLAAAFASRQAANRNPLFDVTFVLENQAEHMECLLCLLESLVLDSSQSYSFKIKRSRFDFSLIGIEVEDEVRFNLEYNTRLFKPETIERFARYFKQIVSLVCGDIHQEIGEIDIIPLEEKKKILYDFNDTETEYPDDKTIHELFIEQAERVPNHVALVGEEGGMLRRGDGKKEEMHLTYRQLNEKSNQLTHWLRERGIKPDIIVALAIDRSIQLIISQLGILKAGGAYLSLDLQLPGPRRQFMLQDSTAKVLITSGQVSNTAGKEMLTGWAGETIIIDEIKNRPLTLSTDPAPSISPRNPDNLAYIIYTSGSTGKPKGVLVPHRGIVSLNTVFQEKFHVNERDRIIQFAAISFDASVWEIYIAVLNGAALYILPKSIIEDHLQFIDYLNKMQISIATLPPIYAAHLESTAIKSLRFLITAGSPAGRDMVEKWRKHLRYINGYGPTEATICATLWEAPQSGDRVEIIPIGPPINNVKIFILDKHMKIMPIGIPGELCISGFHVARGYLNRPGLTAEKFDHHLWDYHDKKKEVKKIRSLEVKKTEKAYKQKINKKLLRGVQGGGFLEKSPPGRRRQKIYKTGDLARWLADGNIEFLGRIDFQVKIRGFRIELGEIENQLLKDEAIKDAVVIDREDPSGAKYLCAYIVTAKEIDTTGVKKKLSENLPDYMLPSYIVPIERIPLTPSGKVDRRALPAPGSTGGKDYAAPTNETEKILAEIWAEVLARKKVGIDDNFFEIGGDSIKAIQIASKLRRHQLKLEIRQLFSHNTIGELAKHLKYTDRNKNRVTNQRVVESEVSFTTIEELERITHYVKNKISQDMEIQLIYPLNPMQYGMFYHWLKIKGSNAYFEQVESRIHGEIEESLLEKSLNILIRRYDILRTIFVYEGLDEPLQIVLKERQTQLFCNDITHLHENEQVQYLEDYRRKDLASGFDLTRDHLVRFSLFKSGINMYILLLSFHHAVLDGWSYNTLMKELRRVYGLLARKGTMQLEPAPLYADYISWLGKQDKEKGLRYWEKYLLGFEQPTGLPKSRLAVKEGDFKLEEYHLHIHEKITSTAYKLTGQRNVTMSTLSQSIWGILLQKYNNTNDVAFGIIVSGRSAEIDGIDSMVGLFINMIPRRITSSNIRQFSLLLKNVQMTSLESKEYEHLQLAEIQSRTLLKGNLIDHLLAFENFPIDEELKKPELGFTVEGLQIYEQTNYDLNIIIMPDEELHIIFNYNALVYDDQLILQIARHFENVLGQVVENLDIEIKEIEVIPNDEKENILYNFNNTDTEYAENKTIHELFAQQAARTPDDTALVGEEEGGKDRRVEDKMEEIYLTYRQLNEKSDQLAYLLIEKGVQPDTIVALAINRSIRLVIVQLGILKAGGAYLSLDPQLPESRRQFMLLDSTTNILITGRKFLVESSMGMLTGWDGETILIDEDISPLLEAMSFTSSPSSVHTDNLAYVIYTSGSTGRPKGVLVPHRGIVSLNTVFQEKFHVNKNDRIIQFAAISFDASVWEIYMALFNGASLHLLNQGIIEDHNRFIKYLNREQISITTLPPIYAAHLESASLKSLRILITAGSSAGRDMVEKWRKHVRYINAYGPTEATICAAFWEAPQSGDRIEIIPIGPPINNIKIYIFDKFMKIMPIGIPGELYISGFHVARGYLNSPGLTAERFDHDLWDYQDYRLIKNYKLQNTKKTAHELHELTRIGATSNKKLLRGVQGGGFLEKSPPGRRRQKIYKTGDLARWLFDGQVEFLGRIDFQVKIRGFRIELGEIENQLLKHENIKDAVVIDREDVTGAKYLCAYITSEQQLNIPAVKKNLEKELPGYMIPSFFIQLEKIPLNPSGKVDRKALPGPEAKGSARYTAPRNKIEKTLASLWSQVLDIKKIGIDDNFFEIGGDSIKTILISARLQKQRLSVNVSDMFRYPTIRELAGKVKKIRRIIDQGTITGNTALTPIQWWFFENHLPHGHHFNQSVLIYREKGFRVPGVEQVFTKIVQHHDALRMVYRFESNHPIQVNRGIEGDLFHMEVIQLTKNQRKEIEAEIQSEAQRIHREMNLESGPLVKLGLFKGNAGGYLLIIIHNLLVDGLSWQILLEDFETGYQQAEKGEQIVLQDKTDSYQYWAKKLVEYSENKRLLNQLPYWKTIEETVVSKINADHKIGEEQIKFKYYKTAHMVLNKEKTKQLMTHVNRVYKTEINDILLSALGLAIYQWNGLKKTIITLEGHGREDIIEDVDITRTVGCFTTQFPVILDIEKPDDIAFTIKKVKETLRLIPSRGIGYGILKYLTPNEKKVFTHFRQIPEITFNYLGQFAVGRYDVIDKVSPVGDELTGDNVSPDIIPGHKIEIEGLIVDDNLKLSFVYNKYEYERSTIEKLVKLYQFNLENIIRHSLLLK